MGQGGGGVFLVMAVPVLLLEDVAIVLMLIKDGMLLFARDEEGILTEEEGAGQEDEDSGVRGCPEGKWPDSCCKLSACALSGDK